MNDSSRDRQRQNTRMRNIGPKSAFSSLALLGILTLTACGGSHPTSGAGASGPAGSFCAEVTSLWHNGGVHEAFNDVTAAQLSGIAPFKSKSELQRAATNAKKLAADAPSGQTAEGADLKTYLNNVAQRLSNAANGNNTGRSAGGSEVMTAWETTHCTPGLPGYTR